ncbi:MAG: WD40/YVTN/BNR-like repeat-containing protein, partial [Acidimicrobiales bacterium]
GSASEALDRLIDARAAVRASAGSGGPDARGLTGIVEELELLGSAAWEDAAPIFRRGAPAAGGGIATGRRPHWAGRAKRRGRGSRRRVVVAGAAATVVAVAVVLATTLGGQPASRTGTKATAVPASWRLAGYIDQPAWQVGGTATGVGLAPAMACPDGANCYAVDPLSVSGGNVLEATSDGGASWQQWVLSPGTRFSSGVVCLSAVRCLAGGVQLGPGDVQVPLVMATSDGGEQWGATQLPASVSDLVTLACGAGGTCVGAGYGTSPSVGVQPPPVVVTSAGSEGWQVTPLYPQFSSLAPDGLACMSTSDCVLVGAFTEVTKPKAAALFSTNGGLSWSQATLPHGLAQVHALSCPDSEHCLAIADPPTVASTSPAGASEIIATADGGRTWDLEGSTGLTSLVLTAISCVTASECWAAGQSTALPVGVVVHTSDGGGSWTPVQLPTSSGNPAGGSDQLDVQNVSTVACATGGTCTALGAQQVPPLGSRQVVLRSN